MTADVLRDICCWYEWGICICTISNKSWRCCSYCCPGLIDLADLRKPDKPQTHSRKTWHLPLAITHDCIRTVLHIQFIYFFFFLLLDILMITTTTYDEWILYMRMMIMKSQHDEKILLGKWQHNSIVYLLWYIQCKCVEADRWCVWYLIVFLFFLFFSYEIHASWIYWWLLLWMNSIWEWWWWWNHNTTKDPPR